MEEHLKQKGKFDYLPWAVVVKQLIIAYPDAYWRFFPHTTYPDGSMMVETSVTINHVTKSYILPVYTNYGGKPKAIIKPDAYAINTAYQRCLVKTIATFGLGLDIFTHDETDELYVDAKEKKGESEKKDQAPPKGKVYWEIFVKEYIGSCTNRQQLIDLWQTNEPDINELEKSDPKVYKFLLESARKKQQEFVKGEKK